MTKEDYLEKIGSNYKEVLKFTTQMGGMSEEEIEKILENMPSVEDVKDSADKALEEVFEGGMIDAEEYIKYFLLVEGKLDEMNQKIGEKLEKEMEKFYILDEADLEVAH